VPGRPATWLENGIEIRGGWVAFSWENPHLHVPMSFPFLCVPHRPQSPTSCRGSACEPPGQSRMAAPGYDAAASPRLCRWLPAAGSPRGSAGALLPPPCAQPFGVKQLWRGRAADNRALPLPQPARWLDPLHLKPFS